MKKLDDDRLGKEDIANSPEVTAVPGTAAMDREYTASAKSSEVIEADDVESFERAKRIFSKTIGKVFEETTKESMDEDKDDALQEVSDLFFSMLSKVKFGRSLRTCVVVVCLGWPFFGAYMRKIKREKEQVENDL